MAIVKISALVELATEPAVGDELVISDISEPADADKAKRIKYSTLIAAAKIITERQGGHATDWSVKGTTDYVPTAFNFQAGEAEIVAANDSGSVTITFPTAFSDKPLIIIGPHIQTAGGARGQMMLRKSNEAAGSVDIDSYSDDALGTTYTIKFSWLAIGPP